MKTTGIPFRTLSSCLPLKAFSHFSFRADASPFMTIDQLSRLKSRALKLRVSLSSDQYVASPFTSMFDSSVPLDLDSILGCTLQILFEVVRILATCFCPNLLARFPEAFHLFQIRSGPILYRNPRRHHPVRKY